MIHTYKSTTNKHEPFIVMYRKFGYESHITKVQTDAELISEQARCCQLYYERILEEMKSQETRPS